MNDIKPSAVVKAESKTGMKINDRAEVIAFFRSASFCNSIRFTTCIVYALPTASSIIGMLLEIMVTSYPRIDMKPRDHVMEITAVSKGSITPLNVLKLINKFRDGKSTAAKCIHCNYCLIGLNEKPLRCYYGKVK